MVPRGQERIKRNDHVVLEYVRSIAPFNMAACYHLPGRHAEEEPLPRDVLQYDPDNQQARRLLAQYNA